MILEYKKQLVSSLERRKKAAIEMKQNKEMAHQAVLKMKVDNCRKKL